MSETSLKISLKAARVNANKTLSQVFNETNISIQRLKRAEKSTNAKLTMVEIVKLCEVYGCEFTDLKI